MGRWHTLREVWRALGVLALLFLNFAHQPVAVPRADLAAAPLAQAFCGAPPGGGQPAPRCDACRIGGGGLMPAAPAPAGPLPQPFCAGTLAHVAFTFARPAALPAGPRAPPAG